MAYILDGTTIRRPSSISESNSTITVPQRTLQGTYTRDIFGSNKRIWILTFENVNVTDFSTIKTIYTSYLNTNTAKTWQITETNYTVSQTRVHVDLLERNFSVRGSSYISSFILTLTEV